MENTVTLAEAWDMFSTTLIYIVLCLPFMLGFFQRKEEPIDYTDEGATYKKAGWNNHGSQQKLF